MRVRSHDSRASDRRHVQGDAARTVLRLFVSGAAMSVTLTTSEKEREDLVRTQPCPDCGAGRKRPCEYGTNKLGHRIVMPTSHTGRYISAVGAGLVPPWVGWPWTS
jgi:hypothetical protein